MMTKYGGNIERYIMSQYFDSLIGKIYKLLPMYEEKDQTINKYHYSLMKELAGGNELLLEKDYFVALINNLESILNIEKHSKFRSQVFKCMNLCEKISSELKGVDDCGI